MVKQFEMTASFLCNPYLDRKREVGCLTLSNKQAVAYNDNPLSIPYSEKFSLPSRKLQYL